MVKVFINGYGNIGRRLATAFSRDPEIQLVGIGKYSVDDKVKEAVKLKYPIYVPEKMVALFMKNKTDVSGIISDAVYQADIVIDASREGLGYENKIKLYKPIGKPAIFQGGEDRVGAKKVANMIHNSRINYEQVQKLDYVIQGSCNVSGMGRMLKPLEDKYGKIIERYDVTLIRRWADLEDKKEVKDSIEWDKNPHHQDDVMSFLPDIHLYVEAYKVPSRMMHLHQMTIRFKKKAPPASSILESFDNEFGVAVLEDAKGTGPIRNKALELGFEHGDTNMIHIHANTLRIQDDIVKVLYSDDQTGMVIPENHLLLQSMVFKRSKQDAYKRTNKLFKLEDKRRILEEEFKSA
ncbi:MAG TPA: type II glyceraldehyde-3-phosphate dehydrogenase [Nitrososphaeraceae archaeon]